MQAHLSNNFMKEKERYPPVRLRSEIHKLLKLESQKSGMPMTAVAESILYGCLVTRPDLCSLITGGAHGIQPSWAVDEEQAKRRAEENSAPLISESESVDQS